MQLSCATSLIHKLGLGHCPRSQAACCSSLAVSQKHQMASITLEAWYRYIAGSRQQQQQQQQQQQKTKTTHHWLIRILKQDEGSPALMRSGVVQVPPDEEARSQQEAQRQQDDQNHAHCNLTSIARKQVCTAQHRPE